MEPESNKGAVRFIVIVVTVEIRLIRILSHLPDLFNRKHILSHPGSRRRPHLKT
jgi:hypothetical protein